MVAANANEGFNAVLTTLLLIGYLFFGLQVLNRRISEFNIGALIGISLVFTCISLFTAVYWGQLSGCQEKFDGDADQYTCKSVGGMQALCAFAVFEFLLQLPFSVGLILWRESVLGENTTYDDMDGPEGQSNSPYSAYDPSQSGGSYNKDNSSADL